MTMNIWTRLCALSQYVWQGSGSVWLGMGVCRAQPVAHELLGELTMSAICVLPYVRHCLAFICHLVLCESDVFSLPKCVCMCGVRQLWWCASARLCSVCVCVCSAWTVEACMDVGLNQGFMIRSGPRQTQMCLPSMVFMGSFLLEVVTASLFPYHINLLWRGQDTPLPCV